MSGASRSSTICSTAPANYPRSSRRDAPSAATGPRTSSSARTWSSSCSPTSSTTPLAGSGCRWARRCGSPRPASSASTITRCDSSASARRPLAGGQLCASAESDRDRAEHLDGDVGVLVQHVAELLMSEHQAAHRRRRHHGRRPWPVVEERDLAEEVTGTERPPTFGGLDSGGAFEDHEEVAAGLALLAERSPRRDVDLVNA